MQLKTAKDMPVGSEVQGRYECWTSSNGDYFSDGQIDRLLAEGAHIIRVPAAPPPGWVNPATKER